MAGTLPARFFLNKKLHKKLKVIKSEDLLVAFCYPDERQVHYLHSATVREHQQAFSMSQVAKLVRRPLKEVHAFLRNKLIDRPSGFEYQIASKRPMNIYWSEDEVYELRDKLYDLAPKNKDGFPDKGFKLASKAEILEEINGDVSYYVRGPNGEFTKVWRAL